MNLVLAIEADSSQADPLGSIVRTKLGAELVLVTSAYAAIVAMNQQVPDLVLFGRDLPQDQRAKIDAVPVPIGTREVVVKGGALGERHESVEVKYGETAELTVTGNASTATPPWLAPLSQYRP